MVLEDTRDLHIELTHILVAEPDAVALFHIVSLGDAVTYHSLSSSRGSESISIHIAEHEILIQPVEAVHSVYGDALDLFPVEQIPRARIHKPVIGGILVKELTESLGELLPYVFE